MKQKTNFCLFFTKKTGRNLSLPVNCRYLLYCKRYGITYDLVSELILDDTAEPVIVPCLSRRQGKRFGPVSAKT